MPLQRRLKNQPYADPQIASDFKRQTIKGTGAAKGMIKPAGSMNWVRRSKPLSKSTVLPKRIRKAAGFLERRRKK